MSGIAQFVDAIYPAFLDGDPSAQAKAAEADHVRRVREMYGAIARGDFAAFAEGLADDIHFDLAGHSELPFAGRWEGRDRVLEAIRDNFAQVEDQKPVVESVVAQGDTVVVVFNEEGRVKATGNTYHLRCVQVFTLRDGRVTRVRQVAGTRG
jgi:ketosteroid isomerase-like protein